MIFRPTQEQFASIAFAQAHPATFINWHAPGLDSPINIAVVDEPPLGSARSETFLLLHGEPSWSALYESWIPRLRVAGYRCVAIDLPGFGRSDKPTDDSWYSYERQCAAVAHVIATLDLHNIHLVVQDWAGPIGLRNLVDSAERFARVFIFNTWLHHDTYPYSDAVRGWRAASTNPSQLGGDMPTGRIVRMSMRRQHADDRAIEIFDAPFAGPESKAGARAFPAMLPFAVPDVGGAEQQQRCHEALCAWSGCPIHVIFSDADPIFPFANGELWSSLIPGATLDRIAGAGHFVQYDAPDDCLAAVAIHLGHEI